MRIRDVLDPRRVLLDVTGTTKLEILAQLVATLALTHPDIDRTALLENLLERERTSTTGIADGIAIPHARHVIGDEVVSVFGRSLRGVNFDSIDGEPTRIFFMLVSPESQPALHLRWLAHLAVLLRDERFRRSLLEASTPDALIGAIEGAEHALAAAKGVP
jgi:PTS system nitrogen regulatory IIA component